MRVETTISLLLCGVLVGVVAGASAAAEFRDLQYFPGDATEAATEKHRLHLFLPDEIENPPLLMWIHGGAWAVGDRSEEVALAQRFVEHGIAVAAISYRLSPGKWMDPRLEDGVQHPAHVVDCARAFAWLHEHAADYGYDPHKLFVGGFSAGAHLAALLALDPRYLAAHDLPRAVIRASIPIAGAYDMESYYRDHLEHNGKEMADSHVLDVFGRGEGKLRRASPSTYLQDSSVPMLVISETDTYEYTRLFEKQVAEAGVRTIEFLHVRDLNHTNLYRSLSTASDSPPRERIVEFVEQQSLHGPAPSLD